MKKASQKPPFLKHRDGDDSSGAQRRCARASAREVGGRGTGGRGVFADDLALNSMGVNGWAIHAPLPSRQYAEIYVCLLEFNWREGKPMIAPEIRDEVLTLTEAVKVTDRLGHPIDRGNDECFSGATWEPHAAEK